MLSFEHTSDFPEPVDRVVRIPGLDRSKEVCPLGSDRGPGNGLYIQALPFVQSYVSCGWGL